MRNNYSLKQNVCRCLVHNLHIRQCNLSANILLHAIDTEFRQCQKEYPKKYFCLIDYEIVFMNYSKVKAKCKSCSLLSVQETNIFQNVRYYIHMSLQNNMMYMLTGIFQLSCIIKAYINGARN